MAAPNCAKAVSYLAENAGVIATLTQQQIETGDPDYAFSRIKETKYETGKGHSPRYLRFRTTPPKRVAYQAMLPTGNQSYNVQNSQTGVANAVTGDKTGAACSLPYETIDYGYDVKTRVLQGKALEIGPWCVMDLLEKEAVGPLVEKLRMDMPRYAKEDFGRQLLRDVIMNAHWKFSVADGFPQSTDTPYFPCVPTGGPSIGFIRQIETLLRAQGWDDGAETPMFNGRRCIQVRMSREAIEWAIEQRKNEKGLKLESRLVMNDDTFKETEVYEGIQFIEAKMPTRGYLRKTGANNWEFVEIDPFNIVPANGEGYWNEPNPDFYRSQVTVGGAQYRVLEVGFIIHPKAMERQALGAIPSVAGHNFQKLFNFEVNPVPDWELAARGCNRDMLYFAFRMTHAYAPIARNPELMTAFLFLSPTTRYTIVDPWQDSAIPAVQPTGLAALNDSRVSNCGVCGPDLQDQPTTPLTPTDGNLFPADNAGTVGWENIAYSVAEEGLAVTLVARRYSGSLGAASAVITMTAGTATNPANWTTPSGFAGSGPWTKTINWADGEYGAKVVVVPIVAASGNDAGKQFTATLGSITTAAALTGRTVATVTLIDADQA